MALCEPKITPWIKKNAARRKNESVNAMKKPSQSAKRSFHQREAVSTGYRAAAND
jgi:hypothetical protein